MSTLPPGVTAEPCTGVDGRAAVRVDLVAQTDQGVAVPAAIVMTLDQAVAHAVQVIEVVQKIRGAERGPRLHVPELVRR